MGNGSFPHFNHTNVYHLIPASGLTHPHEMIEFWFIKLMLQTVAHQGAGRKDLFNVKIINIESWNFTNQELSNFTEKIGNKFVFFEKPTV